MSQFAIWLDTFFASFDYAILDFWHSVAVTAGAIMTPLMEIISITADKGLMMILMGLILTLFPRTRKAGLCVVLAVACGALITNVTLKPLIARARPYESSTVFREWWIYVGASAESDLSFPSGHATATAAALLGLTLARGKKYLWLSLPYIAAMCASRNYLMVHYPSDVLAGVIAGAIGAIAAFFITKCIYNALESNSEERFCRFVLGADVCNLFKSK